MIKRLIALAVASLFCSLAPAQPRLEYRDNMGNPSSRGASARIVANGKPMLMIGGELGNSSASNREDDTSRTSRPYPGWPI